MLQTILKEEEEEFRKKMRDVHTSGGFLGCIENIREELVWGFIQKHNARIIKAVCEEMKMEYRSDNIIISNIEKAKQLIEETEL